MEHLMATIGSATSGSAPFSLESVVTAAIRLIGVLAIIWGSLELVLGIISLVTLWWTFAAADFGDAGFSAVPTVVGGLVKGLVVVAWGVVLAVVAKRLTRFVTKGT